MSALNKYLKVSILALLFLPVLAGAQPLGTWPVRYGTGAPSGIPSGQGTRLYYDITAAGGGQWYEWQPSTGGGCACWKQVGRGIDETDGTGAPTYTPGVGQSNFIVNVENEMFRHTGGGTWVQILAPTTYTAGTGISISGGVISNTIPRLIMQDEGTSLPDPIVRLNFIGDGISVATPFSSQTANVTLDTDLNALANNSTNGILVRTGPSTTGITGRTIVAGAGISIANGTGSGGNPTVTNTGDLSNTNEIQTLSLSGLDLTLSNGGGTITIPGDDALGVGFVNGGGSGTIPDGTIVTRGEAQIIFGGIDPNAILIKTFPSFDPGGFSEISVANGAFVFQTQLGSEDKSINMTATGSSGAFVARNSQMTFQASRSLAEMIFEGTFVGNLTFSNPNATAKFEDYRDEGFRFGVEYAAEYPEILNNDRSWLDVGLAKKLPAAINIIYADLVVAITDSTLKAGKYYLITDYQTTHLIPNTLAEIHTADVEPIFVLATSPYSIAPTAYSSVYPDDILQYTVENLIEGSTKGSIMVRTDTRFNNRFPYDFRGVVSRRWQIEVTDIWDSGALYNSGDAVLYEDRIVISMRDNNDNHVPSDENWWRPFEFENLEYLCPYDLFGIAPWDFGGLGNVFKVPVNSNYLDILTFKGGYGTKNYNNFFDGSGTILNTVFYGNATGNKTGGGFANNNIAESFNNNVFESDCESNSIGFGFEYNKVTVFANNSISGSEGGGMAYNIMTANFGGNSIYVLRRNEFHIEVFTNHFCGIAENNFFYAGIQTCYFKSGMKFLTTYALLGGVDFFDATRIYADFTKRIIVREDLVPVLEYLNSFSVLNHEPIDD